MIDVDIILIAAVQNHYPYGVGYRNKIPWKHKEDLEYFRTVTTNHSIIVGKNTWNGIKHLQGTYNRNFIPYENLGPNHHPIQDIEACIRHHRVIDNEGNPKLFIAGGPTIWTQWLDYITGAQISLIEYDGPVDAYFFINPLNLRHKCKNLKSLTINYF